MSACSILVLELVGVTGNSFRTYFREFQALVSIFAVVASMDAGLLQVLNSRLMGLECFYAPYTEEGLKRIRTASVLSFALGTLPNFIIQIIYVTNIANYTAIPLFTLVLVTLSLLYSVVANVYWVTKHFKLVNRRHVEKTDSIFRRSRKRGMFLPSMMSSSRGVSNVWPWRVRSEMTDVTVVAGTMNPRRVVPGGKGGTNNSLSIVSSSPGPGKTSFGDGPKASPAKASFGDLPRKLSNDDTNTNAIIMMHTDISSEAIGDDSITPEKGERKESEEYPASLRDSYASRTSDGEVLPPPPTLALNGRANGNFSSTFKPSPLGGNRNEHSRADSDVSSQDTRAESDGKDAQLNIRFSFDA